jgi:hypothetical protein
MAPPSPESEPSAVDCSDWLLFESACVIDAGEVCSYSSGSGGKTNRARKYFQQQLQKQPLTISTTAHKFCLYDLLGQPSA